MLLPNLITDQYQTAFSSIRFAPFQQLSCHLKCLDIHSHDFYSTLPLCAQVFKARVHIFPHLKTNSTTTAHPIFSQYPLNTPASVYSDECTGMEIFIVPERIFMRKWITQCLERWRPNPDPRRSIPVWCSKLSLPQSTQLPEMGNLTP